MSGPRRRRAIERLGLHRLLRRRRDAARDPLPVAEISPEVESAVRVDRVLAVDDRTFWVTGWIRDREPERAELAAIAPEGASARIEGLRLYARFDVDDAFASADAAAGVVNRGFTGYVELNQPSRHPTGWVVQKRSAVGEPVEAVLRKTVIRDAAAVEREVADALADAEGADRPVPDAALALVAHRRRKETEQAALADVAEFGSPPSSPEISVVVALGDRLDLLEHQLAQFARGEALGEAELVYVVDPELRDRALDLAHQLNDLYRLPFRIAHLQRASSTAIKANMGAGVARGRLLLFLGSAVFPADPRWRESLIEAYETSANPGAIGPKLLFEDNAIRYAGITLVRDGRSGATPQYDMRGLHRSIPGAAAPRKVAGVEGNCLLVEANLFRERGGFSNAYLDGRHEGLDLCMRLAASGRENWYVPKPEFYDLEPTAPREGSRQPLALDAQLLSHAWDAALGYETAGPAVSAGSSTRSG